MSAYTQINSCVFRPLATLAALLTVALTGCSDPVESDANVTERIKPVARFEMEGAASVAEIQPVVAEETENSAPAASPAATSGQGAAIYAQTCKVCHEIGLSGAPKMGDKAAWEPRIATGMENLYKSSLSGKNAMPPKGGNGSLSDDGVKEAVDFMVAAAQ